MMKWTQGLIFTSIFSYISAIIMTIMGFPPLSNWSSSFQIISYLICSLGLLFSQKYHLLRVPFAIGYGIGAMMSFSGIWIWTNYSGNLALGPYMSVWDLGIAIALLDGIEIPYFKRMHSK